MNSFRDGSISGQLSKSWRRGTETSACCPFFMERMRYHQLALMSLMAELLSDV